MIRILMLLMAASCWGQAGYIPAYMSELFFGQTLSGFIVIDATGEKSSACGSVFIPDGTNRSIRKVGITFGPSITKAGGSALTLSLQNMSTSAGPPAQPDGTQDQTVAIANGSISASTFLLTNNLSADRSIAHGDNLCVVLEFDGTGRLGSDSITIGSFTRPGAIETFAQAGIYTASWATATRLPIVLFEFSDGTYGTLDGASIFSSHTTTVAYHSGSATDEYALKFTVPMNGTIDGVMVAVTASSTANFDVVLYSGTTALTTVSIDGNQWPLTTSIGGFIAIPKTTVSTGTTYYISVKPTTANSVTLGGFTVASNAYLAAFPTGTGYIRSGRVDGGSWSDSNTIVPSIKFRFTPTASGGTTGGAFIIAQ